jgi:hypothetical protein
MSQSLPVSTARPSAACTALGQWSARQWKLLAVQLSSALLPVTRSFRVSAAICARKTTWAPLRSDAVHDVHVSAPCMYALWPAQTLMASPWSCAGTDDWSIHKGSCGYGALWQDEPHG